MTTHAGHPLLGMVRALGMRLTAGRALRTGARTAAGALAALLIVEAANLIVPLAAVPLVTATIAAAVAGLILAAAALRLQRVGAVTASRLIDVRLGLD